MQMTPKLKTSRFAQLELGDLCIYSHDDGQFIVLIAGFHHEPDEQRLIVLGPTFPYGETCSTIIDCPHATAISYGKDYEVRLPPDADGWVAEAPNREISCFALADDKIYFRSFSGTRPVDYRAWYVDLSTGLIQGRPNGHPAYAVKWQIVTKEKNPRLILGNSDKKLSEEQI